MKSGSICWQESSMNCSEIKAASSYGTTQEIFGIFCVFFRSISLDRGAFSFTKVWFFMFFSSFSNYFPLAAQKGNAVEKKLTAGISLTDGGRRASGSAAKLHDCKIGKI